MLAILTSIIDPKYPIRPLAATRSGEDWKAVDPQTGETTVHQDRDVLLLGPWEELSGYKLGDKDVTWGQYAAHQLGNVLRQNELASRLRSIGVDREDEPYTLTSDSAIWRYRFTFTFDELDLLLRAAERGSKGIMDSDTGS